MAVRRRGIVAAAVGTAIVVGVVGAMALTMGIPAEAAVGSLTVGDVLFRALVAIPLGTAVGEELMFRGVLLAAFDRVLRRRSATVATSVLFGLWHLAAESSRLGTGSLVAILPGVAATTAASAFVLCPLRQRFGDLAAPIAVHAATNVAVFAAVVLATRASVDG